MSTTDGQGAIAGQERGSVEVEEILLVDDDDRYRLRLLRALERRGYAVYACASGTEALTYCAEHHPSHALVDLRLAGEWGLQLTRSLLDAHPQLHVVILTAYGSIATAMEAMQVGARDYLQKPIGVEEIERALTRESHMDQPQSPTPPPAPPKEVPSLARVEWEHINRVLTECDGNIRKTAELLGVHRRTLQRKLAKFPVKR